MLPFEFIIDGPPVSQQARRRGRVRQWRDTVRRVAEQNWLSEELPVTGPVMLTVTYFYDGAYLFDREAILSGLQMSERLLELEFPEAALLLAWSSSEATIRLLTAAEGIVLDHLTPVYIIKQAVMHGVISRDEYNFLTKAMQYRNALVHGFKTVDLTPALVKELISTTQRLLQETPTAALRDRQ